MTLNRFFNNFNYGPEKTLLENLGTEMIQTYGIEVAYMKRTHVNIDKFFLEDPLSKFDNVHYVEMYIKDYMGYGMLSDMMSKFGPAMSDTLTLSVSRKRFGQEFPEMIRPLEGDLIYVAMTKSLFEVKYVEHEDSFYQHGNLTYFDIKVERFNYSHETFDTGVVEIDDIESKFSLASNPAWEIEIPVPQSNANFSAAQVLSVAGKVPTIESTSVSSGALLDLSDPNQSQFTYLIGLM